MDQTQLTDFATRYAAAWSSQSPASLVSFDAEDGSLTVNAVPVDLDGNEHRPRRHRQVRPDQGYEERAPITGPLLDTANEPSSASNDTRLAGLWLLEAAG